jgi:ComF family protein
MLALRNLLFPNFCRICGERLLTEENSFFCPACWEASPRIQPPFCTGCGRPHGELFGFDVPRNYPCADCRAKPNPQVRRVYGAALYDGAIEQAVKLLKFHGKERLARPMGEVLREFIGVEMNGSAYDLIVPVPLHPVRERDRGFNQSRLLAREVLPAFPCARIDESLKRIRPTRTQSRLKGKARRDNVRGAFAVVGEECRGKTVLLVDDVVTTAETVTECGKALRKAGAVSVDVIALALAAAHANPDG